MSIFGSIGHIASDGWDAVKDGPDDVEHFGKSAFHHAVSAAKWTGHQLADPNSIVSQLGHTALDAVGEVPIVGSVSEGVNAVWYGAQGDYLDAGLSAASAIPGVGEGVDAMRLAKDGIGIAKDGETVVRDVHDGETIARDARTTDATLTGATRERPPEPVRTGVKPGDADPSTAPHNPKARGPADPVGPDGGARGGGNPDAPKEPGGGGGSSDDAGGGRGPGGPSGSGGPSGNVYSVAYQTELDPALYPGHSRGAHFQDANESLLQAMEGDPDFAQGMQDLGVNLERKPAGGAPRTSPDGWTWHHAQQPGIMQLVPREQHRSGSIFQDVLHPNGVGGYSIWGKE